MMAQNNSYMFFTLFLILCVFCLTEGDKRSLKICVAEGGKWSNTWLSKHCEFLKYSKKSSIKCTVAPDRLHCLHYVASGLVDFTIMEAEDVLLASKWYNDRVVVAADLKALNESPYELGVAVVVSNGLNITSIQDLRRADFCHPGYGYDLHWNDLFSQYFEERVAPSSCYSDLPSYEDRINATASFFHGGCQAGFWARDPVESWRLKTKYPSLCTSCDYPHSCAKSDKYWGRTGSLLCLTDGAGDVVWARVDDIRVHFQLFGGVTGSALDYSFLCKDGSLQPISTVNPCIWLARPWQTIAANPAAEIYVKKMLTEFTSDDDGDWKDSLEKVIGSFREYVNINEQTTTPQTYLEKVPGYLSSSSRSQNNCTPNRSIYWCTTSEAEHVKCEWIARSALVFGIQPQIKCTQKSSLDECFVDVREEKLDLVVVPTDLRYLTERNFNLKSILSETTRIRENLYQLAAIVNTNSKIKTLEDLKYKRACFPSLNGFAWNGVEHILQKHRLISTPCTVDHFVQFFSAVCSVKENEVVGTCGGEDKGGLELLALSNLVQDKCDVVFTNLDVLRGIGNSSNEQWAKHLTSSDFRTICLNGENGHCSWAWAASSYVMIASNMSLVREKEILNTLLSVSHYFGKENQKNEEILLEMFSPILEETNVIFQDTSTALKTPEEAFTMWSSELNYDTILQARALCSSAHQIAVALAVTLLIPLVISQVVS